MVNGLGGTKWVEVLAYMGVGAAAGYFLLGDGKDMLEGVISGEDAVQTDEPTIDAVAPDIAAQPETTALLGPDAAGMAAAGLFGGGGSSCRCVKKKCGRGGYHGPPSRPGGFGGFFWPGFPFSPRPPSWRFGYPGPRPRPVPFPRPRYPPRPGYPFPRPRYPPRPGPRFPPRPIPRPGPFPRPGWPPRGPPRPPPGFPPRPPGGPPPGMPGPPPGGPPAPHPV